ncbi:heterokaryon incompatibility protein-domain-containing protein [Truncatella angustata]|uniref:Heterokaryon incompatibility protein-domain-containing protein n=1 Tax=Truncatella angustata TaxID=152316 RepID=A0A9P8RLM2_9PEZI|nr:heterokaryon incompatibility protein-domain-containing protein [Truncatella angustata]KAH6645585.1 heterokaryon incompatibility protein-domain-containing protein [Truncatella angustata]
MLLQFPSVFGADKYTYRTLATRPRVFRLVKLLSPVKHLLPTFSDIVRVEIVEADLDDTSLTQYETLSYNWAVPPEAQPNRPVIVDTAGKRHILWIHRPLEEALHSISANRLTDFPMFIDQICIDQSNMNEKAVLVPLMGDIYTQCRRVIIWLGTPTILSDKFFDNVKELNQEGVMSRLIGPNKSHWMEVYDAVTEPNPATKLTGVKEEDQDDLLRLVSLFKDRFSHQMWIDVLQRPWFNRLWIIQEVCLAPDVTFLCGSKALCFECFRCSCAFFPIYNGTWMKTETRVVSKAEFNSVTLVYELLQSFHRIFRERKAIHEAGQKHNYYDVVLKYNVIYRDTQGIKIGCSKPEDRLLGVMGLADRDDVYSRLKVLCSEAEGDTRPCEHVYVDFASIAVSQNTDLLSFSQFPKSALNLPSWVPDWSVDLKLPHGYLSLTQPVHAAGGLMPDIPPRIDRATRQLSISGIVIGKISHVGKCVIIEDIERPLHISQLDYTSVRRFYKEADEILSRAGSMANCPFSKYLEAAYRNQVAVRLSDFGLTMRYMADKYGYAPAVACSELENIYEQVSIWGQKLIDIQEIIQSYSLPRIIKTVGIAPYYWIPSSETDVIHLCATDPIAAAKTWLLGLSDFVMDIISVCINSVRVQWTARWLSFMRSRRGFTFDNQPSSDGSSREETVKRMGVDPEIVFGTGWSVYSDFMFRNAGRKLYMTEDGYVGVGPENMKEGDFVVILHGATVPYVLSPEVPFRSAKDMIWAYIGEAYCDGVMEGQLLQTERESVVFSIQ